MGIKVMKLFKFLQAANQRFVAANNASLTTEGVDYVFKVA
jgi:hypothetical protein